MQPRVAMTAKNAVTMSAGHRGSGGAFPGCLEARVSTIVADLALVRSPRYGRRAFVRP